KTKLEKKVAVLESLKVAHYREITRAKHSMNWLQKDKERYSVTLSKLEADHAHYDSQLKHDKDGVKLNLIRLKNLSSVDPEQIGAWLVRISKEWKSGDDSYLGELYGFNLLVRMEGPAWRDVSEHQRIFYAQRGEDGYEHKQTDGLINHDPKLAARYFLNAIDRVGSLVERHHKLIADTAKEIEGLSILIAKPFENEKQLADLKLELAAKEREIAVNIQQKLLEAAAQASETAEEIVSDPVDLMDEVLREAIGEVNSEINEPFVLMGKIKPSDHGNAKIKMKRK
ncbi:MAG: hypothetical protein ABI729_10460, partial [Chitinophagales bacterium]